MTDQAHRLTKKFQKELNAGTVALVLLAIIERATRPLYGYQIARSLEDREQSQGMDVPMMKQGALYPVLRSLEASGLLQSEVEPSVSGPPRRYYQITAEGREALAAWTGVWQRTRDFVNGILEGEHHD